MSAVTCGCEQDIVSLFWYGRWVSFTEQPKIAFHVDLLNTIEFAIAR